MAPPACTVAYEAGRGPEAAPATRAEAAFPDAESASCTTRPPTRVIRTPVPLMSATAQRVTSRSSTTRSAALPGSTVPVSSSWRSCHAVPDVCIRSTASRPRPSSSRYSGPAPKAPWRSIAVRSWFHT